jgi:hypothetical protein
MKAHPYVRAYMAGVFAPSLVLLLALTAFVVGRLMLHIPIPIERVIVFPMALVPNAFGVWNILYVWSRPHVGWTIGLHGAVLPFCLVTMGTIAAVSGGLLTINATGVIWFQSIRVPYLLLAPWFLAAVAIYYLVWKHLVGFLNRLLEIA